MWSAGAGTKLPCPRDSALRRAAFSGNLTALPSHLVPAGRSVRVFISANPEGEKQSLEHLAEPSICWPSGRRSELLQDGSPTALLCPADARLLAPPPPRGLPVSRAPGTQLPIFC
ncbi:NACHT and WD repeat domain containing 2 [Phyllostomus discolor]|uniref:NACHT and WD repeat domain containing 2 n=1 Tax=Phyllostomus discolor TaxID=89673 RepID=A0A834EWG8_9CHIR|nr:NACHT and WD repeat domain containing 2 [Phyllostomus discolor]